MIEFNKVSHSYRIKSGWNHVLNDLSFQLHKGEKLGVIGKNGTGKSTLLRLISGVEVPKEGDVVRRMSVSWPLAFGGAFQGSLSGLDNTRFICRVYNKSLEGAEHYIQEFTELGNYFYEPVKTYSSGMRAKLAFGISMLIDFDCYLIDEITAVGDANFQKKCDIELWEKKSSSAMIIVSHDENVIKARCDKVLLLKKNMPHMLFGDAEEAYYVYNSDQ